ncbi:MAG TPA: heparinase II/III family protein [Armatimonadota bacterium]|nr:heparinase II/III family protein [Armatimonadota bacterium]
MRHSVAIAITLGCITVTHAQKTAGVFYPSRLVETARENIAKHDWAAQTRDDIVAEAQGWTVYSDDELWAMMFGATIPRSWMVWSNGVCPSCEEPVVMYEWEMDSLAQPWKCSCPHCDEAFPKNDFGAFHESGLDEHGVFDPALADRSLLFNTEHPDPDDPLRAFGVDDGTGYVDGDRKWRFIGAYLIYGQWKHSVLGGIKALSAAYVVTGEKRYAHKAGVMLDRVADLYPTFNFKTQAEVYEVPGAAGYVSTWHDACEETRELVIAYDMIFEALREDEALVAFLSAKADQYKLDNPKASFADIQRNIEDRILRDAIANAGKIHSNYPRTPIALINIHAILGWPENRDEIYTMTEDMLKRSTAIDGVTGEKGLAGYSSYVIRGLGQFLEQFARVEPGFLPELLERQPRLAQTYRFHIDTHCLSRYYPLSGDTGWFAGPMEKYVGLNITQNPGVLPSMYSFLWRLYELTDDPAYVQVLYRENESSPEALPRDIFAADPEDFQRDVQAVIGREGLVPRLGSVNKQQWRIGIMRSGHGGNARAAWLDYDSGGGHGHRDGMNLGLFAKGLDLMPDFGYPPVQFGGWGSAKSAWYGITPAHNTVVVDGKSQPGGSGKCTLWIDEPGLKVIRADAPALIGGTRYERSVAQIDISPRDFYLIDIFRVVGGSDHAKFMHSHFGEISTEGLDLSPTEDFGHRTQMSNFQVDPSPKPGWTVDWDVEDRYELLPEPRDIHLRYTDLTQGAEAYTCEAWVVEGMYSSTIETHIPRVMTRRRGEAPLASTFVAVIEPYEDSSNIASIRRLDEGAHASDQAVVVEITLTDGRRHQITAGADGIDFDRSEE